MSQNLGEFRCDALPPLISTGEALAHLLMLPAKVRSPRDRPADIIGPTDGQARKLGSTLQLVLRSATKATSVVHFIRSLHIRMQNSDDLPMKLSSSSGSFWSITLPQERIFSLLPFPWRTISVGMPSLTVKSRTFPTPKSMTSFGIGWSHFSRTPRC